MLCYMAKQNVQAKEDYYKILMRKMNDNTSVAQGGDTSVKLQ